MTRIGAWLAGTLGTLFLLFGYHTSTSATMAAASGTTPVTSSATGAGTTPGSGVGSGSGGTGSSTTYTGDAAATRYGPVQVEATVAGGQITQVSVVQYPNADGRDQQINAYALPRLIDETLSAQSAQVDMVSGASYTSQGYVTSLQSALDQAGL